MRPRRFNVKRHLFNLLAAVSLVVFLTIVLFYCLAPIDLIRGPHANCWIYPGVSKGVLVLDVTSQQVQVGDRFGPSQGWSFGDVHYSHVTGMNRPNTLTQFRMPVWYVLVLTSIAPIAWVGSRRYQRKQPQTGRCLACGYDLRATPDRCPECGTIPTKGS